MKIETKMDRIIEKARAYHQHHAADVSIDALVVAFASIVAPGDLVERRQRKPRFEPEVKAAVCRYIKQTRKRYVTASEVFEDIYGRTGNSIEVREVGAVLRDLGIEPFSHGRPIFRIPR